MTLKALPSQIKYLIVSIVIAVNITVAIMMVNDYSANQDANIIIEQNFILFSIAISIPIYVVILLYTKIRSDKKNIIDRE